MVDAVFRPGGQLVHVEEVFRHLGIVKGEGVQGQHIAPQLLHQPGHLRALNPEPAGGLLPDRGIEHEVSVHDVLLPLRQLRLRLVLHVVGQMSVLGPPVLLVGGGVHPLVEAIGLHQVGGRVNHHQLRVARISHRLPDQAAQLLLILLGPREADNPPNMVIRSLAGEPVDGL